MTQPDKRAIVKAVLESNGQTYAQASGIRLKDTPAPLFQLLNMALLLSARIAADNAVQAAQALVHAKLTTPRKMAEATWQQRVDVITWHGYKRYDERTSTMLGETAEMVMDRYGGDLRKLREEAERDVQQERESLQQFKGIGQVGADIFLREVQGLWREAYPYVDDRVRKVAQQLGLPSDPHELAKLVARKDFTRLVAGLVRVGLAKSQREIKQQAAA